MRLKITEAGTLTIEYIEKYAGTLSKREIAKKLHEDRPDLHKSIESARSLVRQYCGQQGKKYRENEHRNALFFADYAEPPMPNVYHNIDADKARILLIGDVHVPFHDKRALDTAFNYAAKNGADTIVLNGDVFDHYVESFHEKECGNRNPEYDYDQYQSFLFELRCAFPDANIIFKIGNHEKRYFRWFVRMGMADMLQIKKFRYDEIMNFTEHNIRMIEDYATTTVAGLNIIHGHEYRGGGGINPARWLALRTKDSAICGHFHRSSEHNEKTHRGEIQTWWSTGCLCDLQPRYMPYNNWNHGFAFILKDGDMYHVKNKRIFNGTIL